MSLRFINYPHYEPPATYESAVRNVTQRLAAQEGVIAVYQLGGTSAPGISDIDLLAVFEDGVSCTLDPLDHLTKRERYLFTHYVFGVSRRFFREAQRFTRYHHYRLLWGEPLATEPCDEESQLTDQIVMEYLLANYVARTVERTYGIVSLRGVLLSAHALKYDLEFMGIQSGAMADLVQQVVAWRGHWFERPVPRTALLAWHESFCTELHRFASEFLTRRRLFLPAWASRRYTRHVSFHSADTLAINHRGVVLPSRFGFLGRRYVRAQHRLNRFRVHVPLTDRSPHAFLDERFVFLREMKHYNKALLPSFTPLTGSSNVSINVV